MTRKLVSTVVGFVCAGFLTNAVQAQKVYWTDMTGHLVQRADLDGDGQEVIIVDPITVSPVGVAVDSVAGKLYWVDPPLNKVFRANIDGSDIEDLSANGLLGNFKGIALDIAAGKMYLTDDATPNQARILRADLDGSNTEALVSNLQAVSQIALDVASGKVYWTNAFNGGQIRRANLDGSGMQSLADFGFGNSDFINLDLAGGKMYWLDFGRDLIRRANLDGTGTEDLVSLISHSDGVYAKGLALDLNAGRMYWTDHGHLMRSDLNGGNVEQLGDLGNVSIGALTLDSATGALYWTIESHSTIHRADLDWANIETLVAGALKLPRALEQNPETNLIYWASSVVGGDGIFVSDQDGNNAALLLTLPNASVTDIAISQNFAKLYWVDSPGHKIQRSNYDGTGVEDVIPATTAEPFGSSPSEPFGIVIDDAAGKLYWTQYEAISGTGGFIKRADLDGTNVELVYFELSFSPFGIDLDPISSKLYVTDTTPTRQIVRMNLNGTGIETLVAQPDLQSPRDIALDVGGGKIFWADGTRIRRANFDGSNVEDVATGLGTVHGLALDLFCDLQIYCDVNASGGVPNLDDVLCTLRGFANAVDCPSADVKPCEANGTINLDDILSVLAAFGGNNACPDKCE